MPPLRAGLWAAALAFLAAPGRAAEPADAPGPAVAKAAAADADAVAVHSRFGKDGLEFFTADEFFLLRLRVMAQADGKLFIPGDQDPARSGMYLPRVRTYFEGRAGHSFEYEVSLQRSVEGTFDVLDANLNYRGLGDAVQVRFGRMLVPYSYDWYDHLEQFFITPERGLFPLNFGLSREAGVMVWGDVLENRVQYALGGFSGRVAGLADTNDTQDLVGYLNTRPFRQGRADSLRYLNLGGSFAVGDQSHPAEPIPLRTSLQTSENDEAASAASAIFLDYFPDVVADGRRVQGAIHGAWYYRRLSVEAEWAAGEFDFRNPDGVRVGVPVQGWHAALGYFLTGEEVTGRTAVEPLRPFDPAGGQWGPGAVEAFARVSRLQLGGQVFDGGLADPDDWTDRAVVTDIGWNWYPNRYVKFYFDWQHSVFKSPVLINRSTGRKQTTNDLLWVRAQINF